MKKTIIFLILSLFSSEIIACSCGFLSFEEHVAQSDSMYIGVLTKAEIVETKEENEWPYIKGTFRIEENLKGHVKKHLNVKTGLGGGDCGIPMQIQKTYLISKSDNTEYIGICSVNVQIENDNQIEEIIKNIKELLQKTSNNTP